jgi:hypothetical protein
VIGLVAILAVDLAISRDVGSWRTYFADMGKFTGFGYKYSENSIHSFVYETVRLIKGVPGTISVARWGIVDIGTKILTLLAALYFAIRFVKRERAYRAYVQEAMAEADLKWGDKFRTYSSMIDTIGLMLCLSPMVWPHHYVLAMPLVMWAIIAQGRRRPWLVLFGSLFIISVPMFNVYLFSYSRIIGVFMLAHALEPRIIAEKETLAGIGIELSL